MTKIELNDLLFNDEPITINRKLAKCLGLKEAVIFQQIHYWLQINKKKNNNYIDGTYWTFNTIKKWHEEEFDFLSLKTLERTLQALEKEGLLITNTFNKMKGDKTKWYTINYDKLLEVAELRLIRKQELSTKRTESAKKAVIARLDKASNNANSNTDDTMRPNWSDGAYDQIGQTIRPNWSDHTTKLVEAIPETSTKTSTETSFSSISLATSTLNLKLYFEKNICKLGVSTEKQFNSIVAKTDKDLLKAIIDYQESIGTRSYAGFKKGYENFILINNIKTVEELNSYLIDFRQEKLAKKLARDVSIETAVTAIEKEGSDVQGLDITDNILTEIKDVVSVISYNTFIKDLRFYNADDKIIIKSDSNFAIEKTKEQFLVYIKSALIKNNIDTSKNIVFTV